MVNVVNLKDNSMKVSQLNYIPDTASSYPAYQATFNLAGLQNIYTDKAQDYLEIPFTLSSSSLTGFNGLETIAFQDTPLSMINTLSEVGLGQCNAVFVQESNIMMQRSRTLLDTYAYTALNSTLEEIGLNVDDTVSPATGLGYGIGLNDALSDRAEFWTSQVTFSTATTVVNGVTTPTGFYYGSAKIRMKYINDYRAKAGIKKYGFTLNIGFNGINGTNFPVYIASQAGSNYPTGCNPQWSIGNNTLNSLRYWYKTLEFSEKFSARMIDEMQIPVVYDTYNVAATTLSNVSSGTAQNILIASGINFPKRILAFGMPSGTYLGTGSSKWVSPLVTTSQFTNVNAQIDSTWVSSVPFNDSFSQWSEYQECNSFYGEETIAPCLSYQKWVLNQAIEINLRRATLNTGQDPLSGRIINLQFTRNDTNSSIMFCFIFWTNAVRFIYDPAGAGSFRTEQTISLIK